MGTIYILHHNLCFPICSNNQILPNNNNKLSLPEMVITPDNIMYLSDSRTGNLYSLNMTPVRYINFTKVLKKVISIYYVICVIIFL